MKKEKKKKNKSLKVITIIAIVLLVPVLFLAGIYFGGKYDKLPQSLSGVYQKLFGCGGVFAYTSATCEKPADAPSAVESATSTRGACRAAGWDWNTASGCYGDVFYEANVLPENASPPWSLSGAPGLASVSDGILTIDTIGIRNSHYYSRTETMGSGLFVSTRAKVTVGSGSVTFGGLFFRLGNSSYSKPIRIATDGIYEAVSTTRLYSIDATSWHIYHFVLENNSFKIYVDDTLVYQGTTSETNFLNSVSFGDASCGVGAEVYAQIDFVYYGKKN